MGGICSIILAFVLALPGGNAEAAQPGDNGKQFAKGRILVHPAPGLSDEEFKRVLRKNNGKAVGRLKKLGVHIVNVPPNNEKKIAKALSRNKKVKYAEVDELVPPTEILPNDPKYTSAWHLQKIQAPTAWDTGFGEGITVAILDSGVDPLHLDLRNNLVTGRNVVSNNSDTSDVNGHGTKVAGTVAAESNNLLGVTSIAWHAQIMPVRITNDSGGYAYWSDVAAGLIWAADNGARVANISYEVSGSYTVISAAQYMRNKGGVVVVAAGNYGTNPGYEDNEYMVSVAATDSNDNRTSWSNYGNYIDLAAPGVGIWTTTNGGSYAAVSGTSFSSPVTAAVVALVKGVNGDLSPGEVEALLMDSADDLGTAGWDIYYGHGRVNAAQAVALADSVVSQDTQAPTVSITVPATNSTVSDWVAVSVDAADNFGVTEVRLYANGHPVGTDTTEPYTFTWDSTLVSDGDSTLTAHAYDAAGNLGQSAAVTVVVENNPAAADTVPPQVTLHSPTDGATVSGNVTLSASATDDVQLSMVSIYVDGQLKCSGVPSVSCSWNTRKESAGDHSIQAKATDAAGNSATRSITVTVGTTTSKGGNNKVTTTNKGRRTKK